MRYPTTRMLVASAIALLPTLVTAQIPLDHAVVLSQHAQAPAARLVTVNLATGATAAIGRFQFDTSTPLAVLHDPVNRDLIVAVTWLTGSRILRLQLNRLNITSQQVLADVPGRIEDLAFAGGGDVYFITGGTGGMLYGISRNGGSVQRIASLPRATVLFSEGGYAATVFVVQSGRAGMPAIDPINSTVDLRTGKQMVRINMKGYRPLGITGFAFLPNAVGTAFFTGVDGSVGESISFAAPKIITITPKMPAGGTIALRMQDTFRPFVLGGSANPRLKTFDVFGQNRQWKFVTGTLPGAPVAFDVTSTWLRHTVGFGHRCKSPGMLIGASSGGPPKIGNTKFELAVVGAAANSTALLALGLSNRVFAGTTLPITFPGGCKLFVSVDATLGVATNQIGLGRLVVPVPNNPNLIGLQVFAQFGQSGGGRVNTTGAVALHIH